MDRLFGIKLSDPDPVFGYDDTGTGDIEPAIPALKLNTFYRNTFILFTQSNMPVDLLNKDRHFSRRGVKENDGMNQRERELRRARGEIACAECKRFV